MKKRTVFKAALCTTVAVAASLTIMPSPAQAAYGCGTIDPKNEICWYEHEGFRGSAAVFRNNVKPGEGVKGFRLFTYGNLKNLNDSASSVWNGSDYAIVIWEHPGWKGCVGILPAHTGTDLPGQFSPCPNDTASAFNMATV